jgi:hypothetical protein
MEKYIGAVFRTIPDRTDSKGVPTKEKMRKIALALKQYKD